MAKFQGACSRTPGLVPQVLAGLLLVWPATAGATPVATGAAVPVAAERLYKHAQFPGETPSPNAQRIADWVETSQDNGTRPFVIIDKVQAKVFVFSSDGRLLGAAHALMGLARGDDSAPGIGTRRLIDIGPNDRTTPAGRFVASLGRDLHTDILWVDYGTALSIHRVITGIPGDHRFQRLATKSSKDKRITFGCINVPAHFFDRVVLKAFTGTEGVVYILPEVKPLKDFFAMASADAAKP